MSPLIADELAVQALVLKVEQGEPLTPPQLDELERAASRNEGSLDWLLCLAHARVNSERPASALSLLEEAARRRPDEPLIRLARARALGALERYEEAAAELKRVLSRQPGHADAQRALALVRLRQGAPGDAAQLARSVLETDPLDEATRQILAEAEAVSTRVSEPTPRAFARDLRRALAGRGLKTQLDRTRRVLLVELEPGRVGRLSLESLRQAACTDPRGPARFIEALVGSLSGLEAPEELPGFESVRARIFPALRPAAFEERSGPALSSPAPAGLRWIYALDHPGFVTFLPPRAAERWGLGLDEIARVAMENLERGPIAPSRFCAVGGRLVEAQGAAWDVLAFDAGDGYDASRLLSPAHRALLAPLHAGPFAVALPTTAYALLAREGDRAAEAVLRAAAEGESQNADGHSKELFRLDRTLERRG